MNLLKTGWLLFAGIMASLAQAQTEPAQPRYAVEVIIFEHVDQSQSTQELPVPPAQLLPGDAASPLPATPAGNPRPPLSFLLLDPRLGQPDFLALAPGEKVLDRAYRRLEQLDAYRPLVHLAWSQRAWPRNAAQALDLADSRLAPAGLSGQLTLYKERYVHLALDLTLVNRQAAPAGGMNATATPSSAAGAARIIESRRLRGEAAQYFDNPRFGAIAQVWELRAPEEESTDVAEPTG
jgi:hypothetical protein